MTEHQHQWEQTFPEEAPPYSFDHFRGPYISTRFEGVTSVFVACACGEVGWRQDV